MNKKATSSKKVEVGVRKFAGSWMAYFIIGNQSFDVLPIWTHGKDKRYAKWQAEMLRSAFGLPRIGDVPEGADDIEAALELFEKRPKP